MRLCFIFSIAFLETIIILLYHFGVLRMNKEVFKKIISGIEFEIQPTVGGHWNLSVRDGHSGSGELLTPLGVWSYDKIDGAIDDYLKKRAKSIE